MSPKHFSSSSLRPKLCGVALLALTAWSARADWGYPYDLEWQRSFRAGVLVGFNISANFRTSGTFGVSSKPGVYDDGYVHKDDGGDLTSNWGYNNASQYNASSGTLTMSRTDGYSTKSSASEKNSADIGLDLAYSGILWRGERLRIGWELGFGFLPIQISDKSTLSATVKRSTYTFDATGFDMGGINTFPQPGYQGQPNSPSAKIGSTPMSTTQQTINNVQVIGSRTLDADFFAIKLGPTFFWDINPRLGFSIGAGPALGIVTGNLKFNENIFFPGALSQNVGQIGSTELTFGGYVNAVMTFHTVKNGDFYLGAQYMPMGKVNMGNSTRQADLDLRGQIYVMAGINWPF